MRVYILAFNDFMGTQQSVLNFIDTRREILNWFSVLPHSIFFVSELECYELTHVFKSAFPDRFFLISEIKGFTSGGLFPQAVWDFINSPKSSGRWK